MDKNKYTKPSMKVYEIKAQHQLLVGSVPPNWDGPVGYTPATEDNHLA